MNNTATSSTNNNLQFVNKVLLLMIALMVSFSIQNSFANTMNYEMNNSVEVLDDNTPTTNPTSKDADKTKDDNKKNEETTLKKHENSEINNRQISVDIDGEMDELLEDDDLNEKLTINPTSIK